MHVHCSTTIILQYWVCLWENQSADSSQLCKHLFPSKHTHVRAQYCRAHSGLPKLHWPTVDLCLTRNSLVAVNAQPVQQHYWYGATFLIFFTYINIISSFPGVNDVWFSLNGTTYQNNSIVTLEDISEGANALICMTNQTACCRPPYTDGLEQPAVGNWFFPNETRVPSSGVQWDFHRTRGHMKVLLQRKRGGAEGIYRCLISDTFGFTQALYIGVYSASTGELYLYIVHIQSYCSAQTPPNIKKC